jgi:hypothetical protein
MEEMHRTHKEPVWGWIGVVADMVRAFRAARASRIAASGDRQGSRRLTVSSAGRTSGAGCPV